MSKIVCGSPFCKEKSGLCVSNYTKPLKDIKKMYNKAEGGLNCHPLLLFVEFSNRAKKKYAFVF